MTAGNTHDIVSSGACCGSEFLDTEETDTNTLTMLLFSLSLAYLTILKGSLAAHRKSDQSMQTLQFFISYLYSPLSKFFCLRNSQKQPI
jgi:hypothetical protein